MLLNCQVCGKEFESRYVSNTACADCRDLMRPMRISAGQLVQRAIREGELPRPNDVRCVDCGAVAFHYDHRDYSLPLKVDPVCRSCNIKRGPARQLAPDNAIHALHGRYDLIVK